LPKLRQIVAALEQHDLVFYSTAAQVLPVLVIVAIVELRYLPAKTETYPGPVHRRLTLAVCVLATIAEFQLLLALATDNGGTFTSVVGMAALTLAVGMVFSAPVVALDDARNRARAKAEQDRRNQI
jgi:hypothetical protein